MSGRMENSGEFDSQNPTAENRLSADKKREGANRKKNQGHPATSDVLYRDDELEFLMAIDAFKIRTGKKYPTWTEALRVLRALGWERSIELSETTPETN